MCVRITNACCRSEQTEQNKKVCYISFRFNFDPKTPWFMFSFFHVRFCVWLSFSYSNEELNHEVDWSYAMAFVGLFFTFAAGVVSAIQACQACSTKEPQSQAQAGYAPGSNAPVYFVQAMPQDNQAPAGSVEGPAVGSRFVLHTD